MTRLQWLVERAAHDLAAQSELLWKGALYGLAIGGALLWLFRCGVEWWMA